MSMNETPEAALRAGRREWAGLSVLALAALLLSVDLSVLYLALPHLTADLGADDVQQLWILDIYGFMIAGFLVTMGWLGDRVGRRKLLLTGAAVFGLASVLAAFSVSPEMLIATRALMGIAGAAIMPAGLAMVTGMFRHPAQRASAIAAWMSSFMVGLLVGPLIGGVTLEFFWWGAVFLLGVPVMVLLLITGPRLLPESREATEGRIDLVSVALSLAGILLLIYGLKEFANGGGGSVAAGAVFVGLLSAIAFVVRQRGLPNPLLDLRLFASGVFAAALVLSLLGGAVQGGVSLLVTQYLQLVEGLSPLRAGLWLMPATIAMIFGLMLGPGLATRIRPAFVIGAGLPIAMIGYLVLSQVNSTGGLTTLVIGWTIVLFGVGIPMGVVTGLGIGAVPQERVGSASSLLQTGSEFGVAAGIAMLGTIATLVYRNEMTVPPGLPEAQAQTAQDSIAGAAAVSGELDPAAGADLLGAAGAAYTSGLNTTAVVCAVLMAALTVLAVVVLRHLAPQIQAESEAHTEPVPDATTTARS
ncbi:MFS transporter [Micromonospora profundi]|uniref:MFS transporter n=1 Tax=Micromonospora profundi TaxID=1420889 RepID=A0AAJ6HM02_9ACTN|nr:MFS transporter [Micromonospora profundi]WLS43310.1 MFS transporter [Micromonospora profundi]